MIELRTGTRIGALYGIEEDVRGKAAELRCSTRQTRARPLLDELRSWLEKSLRSLSTKSETAGAIRYALSHWCALTRYVDDGLLEIDNSAAERALRAVALGRKNCLFAGSNSGGERAAAIYSLSPPGSDSHRRTSRQPDRRTAPLKPRRRRQYRDFQPLLIDSRRVHLEISGHFGIRHTLRAWRRTSDAYLGLALTIVMETVCIDLHRPTNESRIQISCGGFKTAFEGVNVVDCLTFVQCHI